jgi:membrane dipeptidase
MKFSRRTFVKAGTGAVGAVALDGIATPGLANPQGGGSGIVVYSAAAGLSPETPPKLVTNFIDQLEKDGVACILGTVAAREDWPTAMEKIVAYSSFVQKLGLRTAKLAADIEQSAQDRKTSIVYHCRGSYLLGSPFGVSRPMVSTFNIKRIGALHELGVRVMQLTEQMKGYLGDGCAERTDCGLTDYGLWAVKMMNENGILIDCSEAGHQTSIEAINASSKPIVFSHSNAKALCANAQNISDEQIKAVAAKAGVIGITVQPEMVDLTRPTMDRFLDHIDHVVKIGGIDCVGIGFGYPKEPTAKNEPKAEYTGGDIAEFPALANRLRTRGYSPEDIRKIGGENFLRVFHQAWNN